MYALVLNTIHAVAAILKPNDKKKDKSNITKVSGGGTFTKVVQI